MVTKTFKLDNISKSFGSKKILNSISLEIIPGEILGVLGKSGAGKSTLLKILSGIINSDMGSIDFGSDKILLKKSIGFSFQPYSFYAELSLKENLTYFGRLCHLSKSEIKAKTEELFAMTGLNLSDLKTSASDLSGGMKKRFDIVCSLLSDPKILILDEPTAGLDPLRRKDIIEIMRSINARGVTILISSHIMSDIEFVCDRVMFLENGKIVAIDSVNKIKSLLFDNRFIKFISDPGLYDYIISDLSKIDFIKCFSKEGVLFVYAPEPEVIINYVISLFQRNKEVLSHIDVIEPGLGEVFDLFESKKESSPMKIAFDIVESEVVSLIDKKEKISEIRSLLSKKFNLPTSIVDSFIIWSKKNVIVDKKVKEVKR